MLTCPEPTYEGLVKLLHEGQPSIGVFSNEGGRFIGGHAMNADNRLKTVAALSELWDGAPIRRVRQGDGAFTLHGRRVSLHLMMQPGVAATFLSDPVLKDQGILTRLLVAYPTSTAGTRFQREPNPKSDVAITRFHKRILEILETPLPLVNGERNELAPRPLPLADNAEEVMGAFAGPEPGFRRTQRAPRSPLDEAGRPNGSPGFGPRPVASPHSRQWRKIKSPCRCI